MTGIHDYWAFLLASFLLWITPGPDTMYILARSIAQGRWAGILSGLGIGSGTIVHTLFAAIGLSAVLAASAWAFTCIKVVGACYLIYLGVQALLKPIKRLESGQVENMSGWRIYRQGFLTNLLNPKVAVFFLAFLPQFVDPSAGMGALPFLILGSSFVVGEPSTAFSSLRSRHGPVRPSAETPQLLAGWSEWQAAFTSGLG